MAIKDTIARGIGFTPESVKFIVTHGFSIGAVVVIEEESTSGGVAMRLLNENLAKGYQVQKRRLEQQARLREAEEQAKKAAPKKQKKGLERAEPQPIIPPQIQQPEPYRQSMSERLLVPGETSEFIRAAFRRRAPTQEELEAELQAAHEAYLLQDDEEVLELLLTSL